MKTKIAQLWEAFKNTKFFKFFNRIYVKNFTGYPKIKRIHINGSEYFKFLVTDYKYSKLQPLSIIIENTGTEIVKNVEILNAIKRFKLNSGSVEYPELKISYGIPGISYEDFLTSLLSYKYVINQIRLSYSNESFKLVPMEDFMMMYEGKEINGNSYSFPIYTNLDKNQCVNTIVDIYKVFTIDCFTSLKIQQIPALIKVRVYLYPSIRY